MLVCDENGWLQNEQTYGRSPEKRNFNMFINEYDIKNQLIQILTTIFLSLINLKSS
jgi:membrane associated rhomboid family serine protease